MTYKPLPSPIRITDQRWPDATTPLVSVRCITYNHAKFIRDTIDGFLMQETTFPVEILIHDDASTDGTSDIIRTYEKRHPSIFKVIYQNENQYSKGIKPAYILQPFITGKYIASCEGDDFWTDPLKLETQANYLEAHPECAISGHDAYVVDESGRTLSTSKLPNTHKRDYTKEELQKGCAWILTMSWMYRNVLIEYPAPEDRYIKNGDTFITVLLGAYGGSKYHPEIKPACYRKHAGGIWSLISDEARLDDRINTFFWIYRYFKRKNNQPLADFWKRTWQQNSFTTMEKAHFFDLVEQNIKFKTLITQVVQIGLKKIIRRISRGLLKFNIKN